LLTFNSSCVDKAKIIDIAIKYGIPPIKINGTTINASMLAVITLFLIFSPPILIILILIYLNTVYDYNKRGAILLDIKKELLDLK
jgi:hypothetical protein